MRRYTREYLDQIRQAVPLVNVVEPHVRMKRQGARWVGLCPFHSEKTPSFFVFPDNHYKCFGCGAHGDAIRFLMEIGNGDLRDAVEHLAGMAGIGPQTDVDTRRLAERRRARAAAERAERERKRVEADRAAEKAAAVLAKCWWTDHGYLADKGFPEAKAPVTVKGWLMVPIWNAAGHLRSAQYIRETGDKRFHPKSEVGGNFHRLGRNREVFCCEGYATGLSVFTALRSRHHRAEVRICFSAHNMLRVAQAIRSGPVYVIADNDASGVGEEIAKKSGSLYWMPPQEGTDANDFMLEHGLDKLTDELVAFRRKAIMMRGD